MFRWEFFPFRRHRGSVSARLSPILSFSDSGKIITGYPQRTTITASHIMPNSWTLSGSALDQFDIFQEREYKFNSGEAIRVVTKYRGPKTRWGYCALPDSLQEWFYRSNYSEPMDGRRLSTVATNSIPHAFGYHVYFSGGYYYIAFEDMNTLQFVKSYQATAASGTSSFTYLSGSSEYRQKAAPTTNTFSATTNPVLISGSGSEWSMAGTKPGMAARYTGIEVLIMSMSRLR